MNELSPHEVATAMMTPEQARQRVNAINSMVNNIRALVLDFHDREGWRALGYESWVDCVKSEFSIGQSHVYRLFEAAKIEQRINENSPIGEKSDTDDECPPFDPPQDPKPIPESQLRPLGVLPPEEQKTAWDLAKETAPEGKLTAKHVERVVGEIKEGSAKTYRIRDIATNEWWEGDAGTVEEALEAARGNSFGSSKAKWSAEGCDVKEKTHNGAGGWKKVRTEDTPAATEASLTPTVDCQNCPDHRGMINKHHGVKVPGNSGKCIRLDGPCEASARKKAETSEYRILKNCLLGGENPADLVQKIINLIDTITDDNPRCKEALARIALHVWNRQHKIKAVNGKLATRPGWKEGRAA